MYHSVFSANPLQTYNRTIKQENQFFFLWEKYIIFSSKKSCNTIRSFSCKSRTERSRAFQQRSVTAQQRQIGLVEKWWTILLATKEHNDGWEMREKMRGVKMWPLTENHQVRLHASGYSFNTMVTYHTTTILAKRNLINVSTFGWIPPHSFRGVGIYTPVRLHTYQSYSLRSPVRIGTNLNIHSMVFDRVDHMSN